MAKSRGRKFAELISPTNGVFNAGSLPTIPASKLPTISISKLANSTFSVNSESASLGGNVVIDSNDVTEHTNALYFTNARADARITAAALLPLAGGTMTGNLTLGDNVNAYFGASTDLRIYHDGTNSHIINSTGELRITGSNIAIKSDSNKLYLGAGDDLKIYHDGSNSYIEDAGTGSLILKGGTISVNGAYTLPTSDGSANQVLQTDGSGTLSFAAVSGGGSSVFSTSGSNAYYTSGSVGIGTNTPAFSLHAYHATTNVVARFESGDGNVWIDLHDSDSGTYGALLGHDSTNLFKVGDSSAANKLTLSNAGLLDTDAGYSVGGTTVIDSSRNLVNVNSVEIGDKVTLSESTDRGDLLEITGTTAGWAGLQIRNSSNEGRWSFMTDGTMAGIYDDENADWYMQFNELGATAIFHNSSQKLTTTTGGVTVTGNVTLNDANTVINEGSGNAVRITTNSGYVDIGPQNTTYCHFQTDRGRFYFDKATHFNGQIYNYSGGGTSDPYWRAGNDGSGSGLDADLLDGLHASSFMRASSVSDLDMNTFNLLDVNNIQTRGSNGDVKYAVWNGTTYGIGMRSAVTLGHLNDYAMTFCMNNDADRGFWWGYSGQAKSAGAMSLTTGGKLWITNLAQAYSYQGHSNVAGTGNASYHPSGIYSTGSNWLYGTMYLNGNSVNFSGGSIASCNDLVCDTNYGRGLVGIYSATRYQHVWSMGAAYRTNATGTSYGNMYGLTYTHTNIGTGTNQAISGLSHQLQGRANGTLWWALGNGIWTTGNITAYSDIAVKTNLERIPDALSKVCQLNGYTYDRTDYEVDLETGEMPETRQAGVVAQEVEKVLPEVVSGEEGNKAVAYGNMVSLLIEAIKEQQGQIEDLKQEIETLKGEG